jgi:hypothetical protein
MLTKEVPSMSGAPWLKIPVIEIGPDPRTVPFMFGSSYREWQMLSSQLMRIAVFHVSPLVTFRVGQNAGGEKKVLHEPIKTHNQMFGILLSGEAVRLFAIPDEHAPEFTCQLVDWLVRGTEDEEIYKDLPLYTLN